MATVVFRGTRADLTRILHAVPALFAGRVPDAGDVTRALQLRMGNAFLSQLQQDFLTKAKGGTDRAGIAWAPLSPYTIARRRTTASELRKLGVKQGERGFLTPGQNEKWKRIFTQRLRILEAKGFPLREAKAQAARVAWAELKREGAKTKLGVLGSRTVEIGRDTGRMFRSLAAGYDAAPPASADMTVSHAANSILIGSTVPYLAYFHGGTRRQPARPIAPPDGSIPDAWWPAVLTAGVRGVAVAIEELVRRG